MRVEKVAPQAMPLSSEIYLATLCMYHRRRCRAGRETSTLEQQAAGAEPGGQLGKALSGCDPAV